VRLVNSCTLPTYLMQFAETDIAAFLPIAARPANLMREKEDRLVAEISYSRPNNDLRQVNLRALTFVELAIAHRL
jgi:hypothetical protein